MVEKGAKSARSRIDLGYLEDDISFVTRILRVQLQERNAPLFERHAIPGGVVALLNLIGLNPGLNQKEIARSVVLKKSALTKLLNEMERNGQIERRKGGSDRRLNALYLTEKGEAQRTRMRPDMAALQDSHLEALSPGERAMLFELLWRLVDSLGGPEAAHESRQP